MTCGACAGRVERSLNRREGVVAAGVNFATARARVAFDPARTSPEDLTALVCDLGYGASPVAPDSGLAPAPVPR